MYNAILVLNPVKPLVLSAPKDGTVSFLVNYKNGGGGGHFLPFGWGGVFWAFFSGTEHQEFPILLWGFFTIVTFRLCNKRGIFRCLSSVCWEQSHRRTYVVF